VRAADRVGVTVPISGPLLRRIGHLVGAALVFTTLANGLPTYAKRTGLLERPSYERYWLERCGKSEYEAFWAGLGRRCASPEPRPSRLSRPVAAAYATKVGPNERFLKAAKDAVVLGLLLAGAVVSWRGRAAFPERDRSLWIALLAVALASVATVRAGETLLILAGLRAFAFLGLALMWVPFVSRELLSTVAAWCAGLLLAECALIPGEILYGVSDRPPGSFPRVAGTLVHPNSLGLVVVTVACFVQGFAPSGRQRALTWAAAAVLVACAGSGVGWLVLGVLAISYGVTRLVRSSWGVVAISAAAVLLTVALVPSLTGRADVLASPRGRLQTLFDILDDGLLTVVFGRGLGHGTNTAAALGEGAARGLDSTVTLLVAQGGLLTLIAVYALLFRAFLRGRDERPFLASVLLASVAANVLETFPVNVILGLCLARSGRPQSAESG
jgi:hypothetical protein